MICIIIQKYESGATAIKRLWAVLFAASLAVAGCGQAADGDSEKKESAKTEKTEKVEKSEASKKEEKSAWWEEEHEKFEPTDLPRELTGEEQELMKKPGEYSGLDFDKDKAMEKFKELPDDLTAKQYGEAIIKLVGEDYHEEVEGLVKFDPTIETTGSRPDEEIAEPEVGGGVHYAILLDASGSMNAKNSGGSRMDEAKSAIMGFVDQLPKESTVSLRVYGHKGTGSDADKKLSCSSTENLYSGDVDRNKVRKAIDPVQPAGWTPIGKAIAETKEDIPEDAGSAVVYIVSDGIETCGSDPVAEAKKLAGEGIEPIVNIIGFQVDNEAQKLLKEVAKAGNGTFTYANSKQDVDKYWREENKRLARAWEDWKQEAMDEVDKNKQELMDEANALGKVIMDKSQKEFKHAENIQIDMDKEGVIAEDDYSKKRDVWNYLYERKQMAWNYGYHTSKDAWNDAYKGGNEVWRKIYREGNKKFSEFYHKSY